MIPARSGSKRVPNKNIRLLSGKPLISYVFETCLDIETDVWVNTDCDKILRLADDYEGLNKYKRPDYLGDDNTTNDDFMYDFMKNHPQYDYVIQVLPTSPFITKEEIESFKDKLLNGYIDTLISVKNEQIGAVYDDCPINFSKTKKNPPSQTMKPVQVYATSLMGWKVERFLNNYVEYGCAYHGGEDKFTDFEMCKTQYFPLTGFSKIDIDNEEDFVLAEAVAQFIPFQDRYKKFYYEDGQYTDYIVPRVLKDDGIEKTTELQPNQPVVNVPEVMESMTKSEAWYKTLIDSDSNSCTVVNQMPGEGNRRHYHAKWNEWWYIIRGEWRFDIEDESHIVGVGDLVFIQKGKKHKITAVGETIASRLAVSRYDVEHIYSERPER
jgi:CMP-N-acetylneuraminic acid synthetase/mannose-6-phosphate isomerase-like protein (cupin superfamily)